MVKVVDETRRVIVGSEQVVDMPREDRVAELALRFFSGCVIERKVDYVEIRLPGSVYPIAVIDSIRDNMNLRDARYFGVAEKFARVYEAELLPQEAPQNWLGRLLSLGQQRQRREFVISTNYSEEAA